ncbi:MAG: hypothetical protein U0768_08865 [Anaerolineae bacterium]
MLTPAYRLTFTTKAGGAGGVLGAVASLAGSALDGSGGKVVDTTKEPKASTVTDLVVSLDLDTPADSFTLVMGQVGKFRPQRDNGVTIELGYADDDPSLTQVMAGSVAAVEPGLLTSRVVGLNGADATLRTFVNETYEGQTAGAIVRALAGKAGVEVATADDGIAFPAYVVDARRSVFAHMRDLAALCGFDLYINSDGKLVFQRFGNGNTVHTLEFAKHIVALDVVRSPQAAARVEAWGESPAGGRADKAWAWLIKDFSSAHGTAGAGDPLLLLEKPALRTRDAATTAAEAAFAAVQRRAVRGDLLTFGQPLIKLGDAVKLQGLADDALNTTFQVRSVRHRITKRGGFTTTIGFRSLGT